MFVCFYLGLLQLKCHTKYKIYIVYNISYIFLVIESCAKMLNICQLYPFYICLIFDCIYHMLSIPRGYASSVTKSLYWCKCTLLFFPKHMAAYLLNFSVMSKTKYNHTSKKLLILSAKHLYIISYKGCWQVIWPYMVNITRAANILPLVTGSCLQCIRIPAIAYTCVIVNGFK
jgi:hypothetical protein